MYSNEYFAVGIYISIYPLEISAIITYWYLKQAPAILMRNFFFFPPLNRKFLEFAYTVFATIFKIKENREYATAQVSGEYNIQELTQPCAPCSLG